ncbi:MAG: DbpA RNA binding domain-containing protein, partial [Bacteroidales bacterium]|nr:DbpA RNA binding domain-containing protein [Bacteroidales bacterium]
SKGKKDKIKPNHIIGKINDVTGTKDIRIGRIDMMENFSFVDVDETQAQFIVDCFADERRNKEGIRVEITTTDPKPKKKKEKKQFDDDRPERKNRDKFGDRSYKPEGKKERKKESRKDSRKDSKKDRRDRKDSGRRGRSRSR